MLVFNELIAQAVNLHASDIHFTVGIPPTVRIDGELHHLGDIRCTPAEIEEMALSIMGEHHKETLKNNGEVDFAYSIPGEGRYRINVFRQRGTLAVAVRILNLNIPSPEELGLPKALVNMCQKKRGLVLVTGPTGAGKSTTLASLIDVINQTSKQHIITLEDPIEYLHRHNKSIVNQREMGFDSQNYASALRAALREDPDVLLVGEMRDLETISTAITAAETGHLVLSTLHTNDAPSTIDRLLDMGVESFLISSALKGIISQRLVRRICPNCRTEYTPTAEEQQMLRLPVTPGRKFYRGKGCPMCFNTGYRGRTAVFEILSLTGPIKHAIADNAPHSQLMKLIEESDFEPLIVDCIRLVQNGTTTVEEAYRTVNSTDL